MLSPADFREKQILIVRSEQEIERKLKFCNENVQMLKEGGIKNQLSCHKIFAIFIVGPVTITSKLIKECSEFGISLFLMSEFLKPYAKLCASAEGNYLLRAKQYAGAKQDEFETAKRLVLNKADNQLALLLEGDFVTKEQHKQAKEAVAIKISKVDKPKELLGIEGNYSKVFFRTYFKEMGWLRRMPRAKNDELNVLLDIGYTLLFNYVEALVSLYGFDAYKGCYHTLFFQRKSLVCDLMEPMRCVIDRQLRKSFRLGQINLKDFTYRQGQYELGYDQSKKYVNIFLEAISERKEDMFEFVRHYYRYVIGNANDFPVFCSKKQVNNCATEKIC